MSHFFQKPWGHYHACVSLSYAPFSWIYSFCPHNPAEYFWVPWQLLFTDSWLLSSAFLCEASPLSTVHKDMWGQLSGTSVLVPSTLDHTDVCAQCLASVAPSTAKPSEARAGITVAETSVHQSPSVFPTTLVSVYPVPMLCHTWSSGPWCCLSAPRSKDSSWKQMDRCLQGSSGKPIFGKIVVLLISYPFKRGIHPPSPPEKAVCKSCCGIWPRAGVLHQLHTPGFQMKVEIPTLVAEYYSRWPKTT